MKLDWFNQQTQIVCAQKFKIIPNLKKMQKIFLMMLLYMLNLELALADWWLFWDFKWSPWATEKALRTWDIHTEDIPNMIRAAIDFFLGIAWTISIIFIIVWAYQLLMWSLESDSKSWKKTIAMAIGGFAISALAWFIIWLIINNLSG